MQIGQTSGLSAYWEADRGPRIPHSSAHTLNAGFISCASCQDSARGRLELFLAGSMAILSCGVTNKLIAAWGGSLLIIQIVITVVTWAGCLQLRAGWS